MFNLIKRIINYQDNLYIIKRIIKEVDIKEEFVLEYRGYIGADTVLKKDGLYYFTNKIENAQIIPIQLTLNL